MLPTYILCDDCATGVSNDDWSHLDYYHDPEAAEQEHARISAALEALGWLSMDGPADEPGYFNCAVCDEIQCGGGVRFCGEVRP